MKYSSWVTAVNILHLLVVVQFLNYKNVNSQELESMEEDEGYPRGLRSSNTFRRRCSLRRVSNRFKNTTKFFSRPFDAATRVINGAPEDDGDWIKFDKRTREEAYTKTLPEQYPYVTLLAIMFQSGDESICSGSLITDTWVLTAAHCFYTPEEMIDKVYLYAGGNSFDEVIDVLENNRTLNGSAQLVEAKQYLFHPKYPKYSTSYDIGLAEAMKQFDMTPAVQVVRLAMRTWSHSGYKQCVTTGFGAVRDKQVSSDDGVRKTHVLELKKPCICNFRLKADFWWDSDQGTAHLLCARPKLDYGICSGDSGGGVLCEEDGVMVLRATNQQTQGFADVRYCEMNTVADKMGFMDQECGDKNLVSMFQDVFRHLLWINSYANVFTESEVSIIRNREDGFPDIEKVDEESVEQLVEELDRDLKQDQKPFHQDPL